MRRLLLILLFIIPFTNCERSGDQRKIKLSDESVVTKTDDQLTTTIYLEPEQRRAIAVMIFQNQTGDQKYEWLQKGLTEMLIRTLSQSRSLSVMSTERLFEILERLEQSESAEKLNMEMAAIVGREANVEAVLTGNIKKKGESLQINVKLQEPNRGLVLQEESVEGQGLENIFSMVDNLTHKIKNDLQISLDRTETEKGLADLSTKSLEAWKHYTLAKDLINQYLVADAIQELEKAVELDSQFVSALIELSNRYLEQGRMVESYSLLKQLEQLQNIKTPQEQYQIDLLSAQHANDGLRYIATIQKWVEDYPDDIQAHIILARLYRDWNNYEESSKYFERVVEIDPKHKLAFNYLGYNYAQQGDYDKAVEHIQKYIELASDEPNPLDSMGDMHFFFGEFKKAEKYYKKAIKKNADFGTSLENLGNIYLILGQYEKALEMYENYLGKISEDASKSNVYVSIGQIYNLIGNREKMIESYKKSAELFLFNDAPIQRLHEIYTEEGDTTAAKELLQHRYQQFAEALNTGTMPMASIAGMISLSLIHDVNIKNSIELLKGILRFAEEPSQPIDKMNVVNIKFYLTLLYTKENCVEEIDALWEDGEIFPEETRSFISMVQDQSYSIWSAFIMLNEVFYKYSEEGENFYNDLIKFSIENEAKKYEMAFRTFLVDVCINAGKIDKAQEQLEILGRPEEGYWRVIGPFNNINGFHKKYSPEKRIDLNKVYKEDGLNFTWQEAKDDATDGFINFREIFDDYIWKIAYGLLYVESPIDQEIYLRFGSDDESKVWVNNKEIWGLVYRGPAYFDGIVIKANLKKGMNKILVKVGNTIGNWGFFLRITDEFGNGIPNINFVLPEAVSGS